MSGSVGGTGNKNRVSTNWAFPPPNKELEKVATGLGGSMRAATLSGGLSVRDYREEVGWSEARKVQAREDHGTWFEHHDVPPAYRKLKVNTDGVAFDVNDMQAGYHVLEKLDPDGDLRWMDGSLAPDLVGMLALPVQEGGRRVELGYVVADEVGALHAGLGAEVARMQGEKKAPKVNEYLLRLYDAYQRGDVGTGSNGNGNGSKVGAKEQVADTPRGADPSKIVISREKLSDGERLVGSAKSGLQNSVMRWSSVRLMIACRFGAKYVY